MLFWFVSIFFLQNVIAAFYFVHENNFLKYKNIFSNVNILDEAFNTFLRLIKNIPCYFTIKNDYLF